MPPQPTTLSTSVKATSIITTSVKATSAAPAPTSGSGSGAALYGQCGGQGWAGATTCMQGTCKVINPYYSESYAFCKHGEVC